MGMKRILFIIMIIALGLRAESRPLAWGLSAGIGLPKIPVSHYRTPISVLGSAMGHVSLIGRFGVQIDGNALTTFSLGSVNQAEGDLQFDLYWGSFALTYRVRGFMDNRSAILAGIGPYDLTQEFDQDREALRTTGVNLGFSNWTVGSAWRGIFEVRWHLLFEPSENPQMLTLTFGWLF